MEKITIIESDGSYLRNKVHWLRDVSRNKKDQDEYDNRLAPSRLGRRISRIILTIAFVLMTYNLIEMICLEPRGYVVDIYSALPETLIPSLIICYSTACFLIFNKDKKIKYCSIILLAIILITILIIPYSLNYYSMGRGDDMSYIGEYSHISTFGHISEWDMYPASPFIGATIVILVAIPAHVVSFIIPITFSAFFVVGLYLFGRRFSADQRYKDILLISSFILYLGPYHFLNTPHALFFAFIPFFLFVILMYTESRSMSSSAVMLIVSILIPFTHPFIFLFVFVSIFALLVLKPFIKKMVNGNIERLKTPLLIQLISFAAWFIYSGVMVGSFQKSIKAYINKVTEPVLLETTNKFAAAGFDLPSLMNFLIIYYGRYIIPTIAIMVILITWYFGLLANSKLKKGISLLLLAYLVAIIVEIIVYINPIIAHQPDRMSNLLFIVYFQVPLFAVSLMLLSRNNLFSFRRSFIRKTTVISVIILTFGLSLFGAFDSPNISRANVALTDNEVVGMEWLYYIKDGQTITAPLSQIDRFHDIFNDDSIERYIYLDDHFGYNSSGGTFSEIVNGKYEGRLYVATMTVDKVRYEEIPAYAHVGRYAHGDYLRFTYDNTVNRIYCSKNIDISVINA